MYKLMNDEFTHRYGSVANMLVSNIGRKRTIVSIMGTMMAAMVINPLDLGTGEAYSVPLVSYDIEQLADPGLQGRAQLLKRLSLIFEGDTSSGTPGQDKFNTSEALLVVTAWFRVVGMTKKDKFDDLQQFRDFFLRLDVTAGGPLSRAVRILDNAVHTASLQPAVAKTVTSLLLADLSRVIRPQKLGSDIYVPSGRLAVAKEVELQSKTNYSALDSRLDKLDAGVFFLTSLTRGGKSTKALEMMSASTLWIRHGEPYQTRFDDLAEGFTLPAANLSDVLVGLLVASQSGVDVIVDSGRLTLAAVGGGAVIRGLPSGFARAATVLNNFVASLGDFRVIMTYNPAYVPDSDVVAIIDSSSNSERKDTDWNETLKSILTALSSSTAGVAYLSNFEVAYITARLNNGERFTDSSGSDVVYGSTYHLQTLTGESADRVQQLGAATQNFMVGVEASEVAKDLVTTNVDDGIASLRAHDELRDDVAAFADQYLGDDEDDQHSIFTFNDQ